MGTKTLKKLPYIEAAWYTKVSGDREIDLVVIHDMEFPERSTAAEDVANYFANLPSTRKASAHVCFDSDSGVRCVFDNHIAYTAPGANHNGLHIELAGYAAQTKAEWKDDYSRKMLSLAARWVAKWCVEHDIPTRFISAQGLRDGKRGITTHWEVTKAFHESTHTDPGPNFPKSWFLKRVKDAVAEIKGKDKHKGRDERRYPATVARGDKGWAVKKAQRRLKIHGFKPGKADGKFGAKTERAVKAFQKRRVLPVDGIVGERTWRQLFKEPK